LFSVDLFLVLVCSYFVSRLCYGAGANRRRSRWMSPVCIGENPHKCRQFIWNSLTYLHTHAHKRPIDPHDH